VTVSHSHFHDAVIADSRIELPAAAARAFSRRIHLVTGKGGVGRSYADAPEIDGVVKLLPPEKLSKVLKVGEFTRAKVVATDGHDLVALPI
jgi:hypothetical protein